MRSGEVRLWWFEASLRDAPHHEGWVQRRMSEAGSLAGRLTPEGHELFQRVYFEDTDFSGLVYHARYLHFMERGRSDFLRLIGIHHRELSADGFAFAVRRLSVDFLRPAVIDDVLRIATQTVRVGGARIELDQAISRGSEDLLRAAVTVVLVGPGGRAARLPGKIRDAFAALARVDRSGPVTA